PFSQASWASSAVSSPLTTTGRPYPASHSMSRQLTVGSTPSPSSSPGRSRAPEPGSPPGYLVRVARDTGRRRSAERRVAGRDGFVDGSLRRSPLAPDVVLVPPRPVARQLGRCAGGCRGEAHDRPGRGCGARGRLLTARMRHPLHRQRGDQDWKRNFGAEHRPRGRDRADVDEDARAELPALERRDIVGGGDLAAGPAEEVRGRVRVELPLREALVVPDVDRPHAPIKDETRLR